MLTHLRLKAQNCAVDPEIELLADVAPNTGATLLATLPVTAMLQLKISIFEMCACADCLLRYCMRMQRSALRRALSSY